MDNNQETFLDKKTLIAIAVVGLVWVGWQQYLTSKYGNKTEVTAEATPENAAQTAEQKTAEVSAAAATQTTNTSAVVEEKTLSVESESLNAKISSRGMGLTGVTLLKYTDRKNEKIQIGTEGSFALYAVGATEPLQFNIEQKSATEYVGKASVGATTVEQTIRFNEDHYSFASTIQITGKDPQFKGLEVRLPEKVHHYQTGSFFMPSFDAQDVFFKTEGKSQRMNLIGAKERVESKAPLTTILASGTQYFASAIKDNSPITPESEVLYVPNASETNPVVSSKLIYNTATATSDQITLKYTGFVGPKSYGLLKKIDPEFVEVIDYGFFGTIAKILLQLLLFLHTYLGNWGLAIIFLTLLVRLVVMPFNISSYKSMKRMQSIQPAMQALREKYKGDPQTLNKEMMTFMKENKVNPVGGCLPMLLQMPIFFALFQVLRSSIELYKAPFFGWITDLSAKDPFYVLPILMGICMYLQSKLTPNTMPPEQARIMQFLPLVFAAMMIAFPSGLNLYMFVSTLFAVIQQQLFMKDKTAHAGATKGVAEKMKEA